MAKPRIYVRKNVLVAARIINLYDQDEFAKKCKVSKAHYNRIENGKLPVGIKTAKLIAKRLNKDFDDLFEVRE